MIKKGGRSIGRTILTSSKIMDILPWFGIGIAVLGIIGLIMGSITVVFTGQVLIGATAVVLDAGLTACGITLFFAMCIVQDITGMF